MYRAAMMLAAMTLVALPAAAQQSGSDANGAAAAAPTTASADAQRYGEPSGHHGASAVEVTFVPVGGMFFRHRDSGQPQFANYNLGGSITGNINQVVGVEGDLGWGLGVRQDLVVNAVPLINQKTPDLLTYTGNLMVNVIGSHHAFAPYVVGGLGGLTVFNTAGRANVGVTGNETYLMGDVGAGARAFVTRHVGFRADYRYLMIRNKSSAPLFFGAGDRFAHRIYAALVFTY